MSRPIRRIRRPDVVTIRVATIRGVLTITGVCVIGHVHGCDHLLKVGCPLAPALACLRSHGFCLIANRTNVRVLRRYKKKHVRPVHPVRPRPC